MNMFTLFCYSHIGPLMNTIADHDFLLILQIGIHALEHFKDIFTQLGEYKFIEDPGDHYHASYTISLHEYLLPTVPFCPRLGRAFKTTPLSPYWKTLDPLTVAPVFENKVMSTIPVPRKSGTII